MVDMIFWTQKLSTKHFVWDELFLFWTHIFVTLDFGTEIFFWTQNFPSPLHPQALKHLISSIVIIAQLVSPSVDLPAKFGFVKTQHNSTQLNSTKATQKQLRWVRHSTHLEPTPPHPTHTTPNFSGTSRPARELKFGT